MTGIAAYCTDCGLELSPGARFCAQCGAQQHADPPVQGVSGTTAIALSALLGVLGMILIAAAVGVWEIVSSSNDDQATVAALFAALALTVAALGVVAGDVAFVNYLRKRGADDWAWWSQLVIVPVWLFVFLAALIGVTSS